MYFDLQLLKFQLFLILDLYLDGISHQFFVTKFFTSRVLKKNYEIIYSFRHYIYEQSFYKYKSQTKLKLIQHKKKLSCLDVSWLSGKKTRMIYFLKKNNISLINQVNYGRVRISFRLCDFSDRRPFRWRFFIFCLRLSLFSISKFSRFRTRFSYRRILVHIIRVTRVVLGQSNSTTLTRRVGSCGSRVIKIINPDSI